MSYEIKPSRGANRVRETAPAYGDPPPARPSGFRVTVADRGRVVLPAEVRERLRIKDGDWLTLILEPSGAIKMLTGAVYARSLRGMFKHLARPGRSWADELIAERRREAAKDEREYQKTIAYFRRKKRR
ncbi:MAG: AbrB/MazE/SpoVT family DNA-binding domain-containing protein [Acidobacteria bacterium]|nr:AbrB/MazE/SpoVT family DNA-binding domain-containing protein [Acidobacteriota bacterium]